MDNFKITDAQLAELISNLKNAKQKLLETNAAMWLNKIRWINQLTPKYIQLKIKGKYWVFGWCSKTEYIDLCGFQLSQPTRCSRFSSLLLVI
jgi:hypothetical protein